MAWKELKWVEKFTKANEPNMNNIEEGIKESKITAETAKTEVGTAKTELGTTKTELTSLKEISITSGAHSTAIGQIPLSVTNNSNAASWTIGTTVSLENIIIGSAPAIAGAANGNASLGKNAFAALTEGAANSAFGRGALSSIKAGNKNSALGSNAGSNATASSSSNIFIGASAGPVAASEINNKLYIHNSASDNPLIYGDFNAKTCKINGTLGATSYDTENIPYLALNKETKEKIEKVGPQGPEGPGLFYEEQWKEKKERKVTPQRSLVSWKGTSYICIKAVTAGEDREPGTAEAKPIWEVLAEKGEKGEGIVKPEIAMVYRVAPNESFAAGTNKVNLNKVITDQGGNFNTTENWYSAPAEGFYHIDATVLASSSAPEASPVAKIYINKAEKLQGSQFILLLANEQGISNVSGLVFCKSGDKIELYISCGGTPNIVYAGETNTRMSVYRVA